MPLTVAQHIEDSRDLVDSFNLPTAPTIVGLSRGAMLALAFAVENPAHTSSLALVGCGTIDARLTEAQRNRLTSVTGLPASQAWLAEVRDLIRGVWSCDAAVPDADDQPTYFIAYQTICRDMLRL